MRSSYVNSRLRHSSALSPRKSFNSLLHCSKRCITNDVIVLLCCVRINSSVALSTGVEDMITKNKVARKIHPHKQSLWWLCMPLNNRFHQVKESTELCACLNGASLNMDSPFIMTPPPNYYDLPNYYYPPIILTPTIIMTPKIWSRLIIDITIILYPL